MRKFNVIIDGVSYGVEVEEDIEDMGKEISMEAIEAAQIKTEEKPAAKKVSQEGVALRSPLPGMVMSLKTTSGAVVKKGQIVLILEAMKMENEIAANADGIITFAVTKGTNVNTGDILAHIK